MSLLDWHATFGSRLEFVATTIGLAWISVFGLVLALQRDEKLVGEHDQPVDLVLVPVDPPALGVGVHGHEVVVPLPDDEGALRA
jgi:hypothetical protein